MMLAAKCLMPDQSQLRLGALLARKRLEPRLDRIVFERSFWPVHGQRSFSSNQVEAARSPSYFDTFSPPSSTTKAGTFSTPNALRASSPTLELRAA